MDIIFLRGLHIETVIGIYEWERRVRQTVVIDLELGTDIRPAADHDDIARTLDYGAISARMVEFVTGSEFLLVETLAERLAALVREEFGVAWVRLTINKKGAIQGASDVGVMITRGHTQADC
ncbi:MAG: dihydroneopterin aldolase [Methylococcaceae bacterium]